MHDSVVHIKRIVIALLIMLLAVSSVILVRGWAGGHFRSIESLRQYIGSFGGWGPVMLTIIQALQVVLPVLPGFLGCIVGAALFGPAGGFWVNYIGISAGSIAAYWLARRYGVPLVQKMISMEKYASLIQWIEQKQCYTLIFALAILLPLAPDDFFCYFSGLAQMPARRFIWIILLAKPWCILFYSLFFSYFL